MKVIREFKGEETFDKLFVSYLEIVSNSIVESTLKNDEKKIVDTKNTNGVNN